jgi:hypothetical protein
MNELDKLGEIVASELRDSALNRYLDIESGFCGSAIAKQLHEKLQNFDDEQKVVLRAILTDAIDTGIHDFLFAIQESEDVKIVSGNKNVVELSDGLNGEIFTEDGWFEKYSQHKESGI